MLLLVAGLANVRISSWISPQCELLGRDVFGAGCRRLLGRHDLLNLLERPALGLDHLGTDVPGSEARERKG